MLGGHVEDTRVCMGYGLGEANSEGKALASIF